MEDLLLEHNGGKNQWTLRDPLEKAWPGLGVDFSEAAFQFRVKRSAHSKEILRDALKIKGHNLFFEVLDSTAGLGEDAFMMAHWGYPVVSYERHPIVYFLLSLGWINYKNNSAHDCDAMNWKICFGDFSEGLTKDWGACYLDPMFPPSPKKALNKKDLRVLHEVIGADAPNDEQVSGYVHSVLDSVKQKIILKRPQRATVMPCPGGCAYYSIEAPSVRLDVFNKI